MNLQIAEQEAQQLAPLNQGEEISPVIEDNLVAQVAAAEGTISDLLLNVSRMKAVKERAAAAGDTGGTGFFTSPKEVGARAACESNVNALKEAAEAVFECAAKVGLHQAPASPGMSGPGGSISSSSSSSSDVSVASKTNEGGR